MDDSQRFLASVPTDDFTLQDDQCLDWLWRQLYSPDGTTCYCSRCGTDRRFHRLRSRPAYSCDICGWHLHPTAGTFFQKTRTPLSLWFEAIATVQADPTISGTRLSRALRVSHATALRMRSIINTAAGDCPAKGAGSLRLDNRKLLDGVSQLMRDLKLRRHPLGEPSENDESGRVRRAIENSGPRDMRSDVILSATRHVLASRGIAEIRVADIAAEAGVSSASVHYYYSTKDDTISAALAWQAEEEACLRRSIVGGHDKPFEKIMRLVGLLVPDTQGKRERILSLIDLRFAALRNARYRAISERTSTGWRSHVLAVIEEGVASGDFRLRDSPDDMAQQLMALADGYALEALAEHGWMSTDRMYELLVQFVSRELGLPNTPEAKP